MSFWASNLQALSRRRDAKTLAAALEACGPAPDLGLRSREGEVLPGLLVQNRPRALVSQYSPEREAQNWAAGATGTVAVFGGAGTAAAQALAVSGVGLIFWVEPRLEVWCSLLTFEDWSGWINRDEWVPVWDESLGGQSLRTLYHPLWNGAFRTLEWRSAVQGFEPLWTGFREEIRRVLENWSSDASTQARFGERWYRNTLENLKHLTPGRAESCAGARVVVAGAGPGLDDELDDAENLRWLEKRRDTGDRLFSTDTALPALSDRGIIPDLVFCLDGQLPSYHHFVPARPAVSLVADLASLPLLGRIGMPVVRYLSGHPFGAVIRRFYPELPVLDGSLGNVSGLARMAAFALGARKVDAWGVDFAYRGQAYARGTYVYELAGRSATRLQPSESRLTGFYGATGLEASVDARGRLYTTPLLRDYRQRWEAAPETAPAATLSHGGNARWRDFRDSWKSRLENLPLPRGAMNFFVGTLPADIREDWWALWPLALSLHRQGVAVPQLPAATIERALSYLAH